MTSEARMGWRSSEKRMARGGTDRNQQSGGDSPRRSLDKAPCRRRPKNEAAAQLCCCEKIAASTAPKTRAYLKPWDFASSLLATLPPERN